VHQRRWREVDSVLREVVPQHYERRMLPEEFGARLISLRADLPTYVPNTPPFHVVICSNELVPCFCSNTACGVPTKGQWYGTQGAWAAWTSDHQRDAEAEEEFQHMQRAYKEWKAASECFRAARSLFPRCCISCDVSLHSTCSCVRRRQDHCRGQSRRCGDLRRGRLPPPRNKRMSKATGSSPPIANRVVHFSFDPELLTVKRQSIQLRVPRPIVQCWCGSHEWTALMPCKLNLYFIIKNVKATYHCQLLLATLPLLNPRTSDTPSRRESELRLDNL